MTDQPATAATELTAVERNAQQAVRNQGLCGAVGNGRVCIRDPHDGPHGFEAATTDPTIPEPLRAALLDRLLWMADLDRKFVMEALEDALDTGYWEVRYVGPG